MSQSARLASGEELSERLAMRQFTNLDRTVERPVNRRIFRAIERRRDATRRYLRFKVMPFAIWKVSRQSDGCVRCFAVLRKGRGRLHARRVGFFYACASIHPDGRETDTRGRHCCRRGGRASPARAPRIPKAGRCLRCGRPRTITKPTDRLCGRCKQANADFDVDRPMVAPRRLRR